MSLDPRHSETSGGGARRGLEAPDWHQVQRAILAGRQLRAEWLRQHAGRFNRYLRERWLEPARRARRRRADLEALIDLDEHTLADIGVRRSEVQGVLYGMLTWHELGSRRDERRLPLTEVVRLERNQSVPESRDLDKAA